VYHGHTRKFPNTYGQFSLSSNSHTGNTLVPTLDHLTSTQSEGEGRTSGVGIELLSVQKLSDVPM
jgi:hypothetical protein